MPDLNTQRRERRYNAARDDQRSPFERDRDRILYSSAFRRLSGVTQIVRSGEADVFHDRLQHSIKVAQVGRRLAQFCIANQPDEARSQSLDVEVVEAACLAHDLGHPPFGHAGEHVLNGLVSEKDPDGFEGNAQSFRILTKLAVRFEEPGLDLTRATLAACIKYPWLRDPATPGKKDKWGAYRSEEEDFRFAREGLAGEFKSVEAELMDWADDIAYSVHDLEDFHRCGVLPWRQILDPALNGPLVDRAEQAWFGAPTNARALLVRALASLEHLLKGSFLALIEQDYEGTRDQRALLRTLTSALVARYMQAPHLSSPTQTSSTGRTVEFGLDEVAEVRILKQITRDYILNSPALAAQQRGHERVLRHLFGELSTDAERGVPRYLPKRLAYLFDLSAQNPARFAADCIASLTEGEAIGLYGRLTGTASGSVLDPIVR